MDKTDKLIELGKLLEQNLINKIEFEKLKKDILLNTEFNNSISKEESKPEVLFDKIKIVSELINNLYILNDNSYNKELVAKVDPIGTLRATSGWGNNASSLGLKLVKKHIAKKAIEIDSNVVLLTKVDVAGMTIIEGLAYKI